MSETNQIYFKQLLSGIDLGVSDPSARSMANFVYLIGDTKTRECVVVDPAWDIEGILKVVEEDDMKLTGALVTHYHPCLLYTSPSPRDRQKSRMPSSA